ncbi:retrovirus-related Pol polyprotein from transposon TNT 1-94 [Trifolium medium]|uniref:Retrovirus-related Pol polyprotein from transposon TNT 1-94 n=1 Tax=Trifolium medium TaxID=97028 RepID=A0A392LYD4_9FABA|nr:retrovirus-related Pol polyprotein from transposon TNT 1-94 [Trifolium medium]
MASIIAVDSTESVTALHVNSSQGYSNGKGGQYNKGKGFNSAQKGVNQVCTHCGKTNHIVDNCFVKHGFPPGYRQKGKNQSSYQGSSQSQVNNASNDSAPTMDSSSSSFGFTQEEFQSIRALLQQSKSTPTVNSVSTSPFVMNSYSSNNNGKHSSLWILDTGATDHISFNLASFTSYQSIIPVPVSLPNGSQISASISGNVVISPSLTLHNVLYIPSFHTHSRETIGTAKLQRGLYVIDTNGATSNCNSVVSDSFELWHLRLGHISNFGIQAIAKQFLFIPFHIINRLPSPLLKSKCPYELLFKSPPILIHLKVFGCLSFATTLQAHRTKFDSRARKAVFLGFKDGTKGYILYDLQSHALFISRNVVFYENYFPFKDTSNSSSCSADSAIPVNNPVDNSYVLDSDHIALPSAQGPAVLDTHSIPTSPISPDPIIIDHDPINFHTDTIQSPIQNGSNSSPVSSTSDPNSTSSIPSLVSQSQPIIPRKSTRVKNVPGYLQDYHCCILPKSLNNVSSLIAYPLSSVLSYKKCSPTYKTFCCSISSQSEPKTYNQASKFDCWKKAMDTEIAALDANQTWNIVDLPLGKIPVGCKWVYKIKYHANGSIERYKARLVAKGYTQCEGVDYFDTFSPVAKITTVRVLLSIAAIKNWHLEQLDVNNAFLHEDLNEEVYMSLPPGYGNSDPNKVCKLNKSLYGLKQASRQWHAKLSSALLSLGYVQSQADYSLYTKHIDHNFTALLVYVDDIVLTGNSIEEIRNVKSFLDTKFRIKDLGQLRYFLGLEIARSTSGIFLNQRKYVLELLEDTGFLGAKPISTPFDPSTKLSSTDGVPLDDPSSFRRLIGRLLYLTNTRPDISFSVQHLSQYVANPFVSHYQAATRILRYLKAVPAKGILFSSSSSLKLHGFADSDWARCPDTRKSVTGYCVLLGNSLISWRSKKQNTVSRSSTEAEYRALASLTCEIQWLSYLFHDFNIQFSQPASLYCDSKSAIYLAHNPTFHERSKYIELDCHVIREKLQSKLIHLFPVPSSSQLADVFTKPLHSPSFCSLLSKLGLCNIHSPTCGEVLA